LSYALLGFIEETDAGSDQAQVMDSGYPAMRRAGFPGVRISSPCIL